MNFKLSANRRFVAPIVFTYAGEDGEAKAEIRVIFEAVGNKEWRRLMEEGDLSINDFLRRVVKGWGGVTNDAGAAFPFSAEALDALLDVEFMAKLLMDAYQDAYRADREKNFKPPLG